MLSKPPPLLPVPLHIQELFLTQSNFSCKYIHSESCEQFCLDKGIRVMKMLMYMYIPIHFAPMILYKRKQLKARPIPTTARCVYNLIRSLLFIGTLVGGMRYLLCKLRMCFAEKYDGSLCFWAGFLSGFSIFFESESRRWEIALFILPRCLETLINLLVRRKMLKRLPKGDTVVFALIIGVLNYYLQNKEQALKETYRKILVQMWGNN